MFRRLLVIGMLWCLAVGVSAQGAPAQIDDALAALNARLGTNLTLNDLYWSWSQFNAPDSSLGCPVEGEMYTQAQVVTYRFTFEHAGVTYDYRVAADRSVTRLCENAPEEAEPETEVDPLSNRLCAVATDAPLDAATDRINYMRSRVAVGVEARVTLSAQPNRLREAPNTTSAILGEMPAGSRFEVVSGAVCDPAGIVWWEVLYNGATGWTAEGQEGTYFIEPLPLAAALPTLAPLNPVNVGTVREVGQVQGNLGEGLAYTADGVLVVLGAVGAEGLVIYDDLTVQPRLLPLEERLTQLVATDAADRLAVGVEDGTVRLLNPKADARTVTRVALNGHQDPVDAVSISPDAALMASSGGVAYLSQNTLSPFAVAVWDLNEVYLKGALTGQTDTVTAIAFIPETNHLIYSSLDGGVRIASLETFTEITSISAEVGVSSLVVSADGLFAVAGYTDGSLVVIDLRTYQPSEPILGHRGVVNALALSPDGALLASVGDDDQLLLWTVDSLTTAQPLRTSLSAGHGGVVYDVAFHPDGAQIVTLGADHRVRVWGAMP